MCEFSERLISWLDRELESDEMTRVERHVRDCVECRGQLDAYREVSRRFDAYCDSVMESKVGRRMPRWVPVLSSAAAVVIAAALLLVFVKTRVQPLGPAAVKVAPAPPAVILETRPAAVVETTPTTRRPVHRRREPVQVQSQNPNWPPTEPAIEIVVPAESMFPPGAVPEGFTFTADLSVAADGSAQQIRLRPQLVGFERRMNQP
jgi:Putative zinc-finger